MHAFAHSTGNAVFFYVYQDGKKKYNLSNNDPHSLEIIGVSIRAGIASMVTTLPLWTVKTRVVLFQEQSDTQIKTSNIYKSALKDIYSKGGVPGFYRGLVPGMLMSLYGVIKMYSYEMLTYITGFETGSVTSLSAKNVLVPFIMGGMARSIASSILIPVNIMWTRLQMRTYT